MSLHLIIFGRVQKVGYRAWTVKSSRELGLNGWVRNLSDGTVEAQIDGPKAAMEALVQQCWRGPFAARVDHIEIKESAEILASGFEQRTTK